MVCLVLAAGYATRLYPLTENFPKPLLEVKEKPILDWLLDDLDSTGEINSYVVVSNHKFAPHFDSWAKNKKLNAPIIVVDDKTESNETRLGAVMDIAYAMDEVGIDDDLMVIAGDNVLDFSLNKFIRFFKDKSKSCVLRYFEADTARLKKCGVAEIDDNSKIISMTEKPENPKSNWCIPPFYIYKKDDLKYIKEGIESGCSVDAPGSFVAWLSQKTDVLTLEMPGKRYDIGNLESYKKVQEDYKGIAEE